MPYSAPVALLVLLALCALAPLAFASPPDPLWIGGLFDAGDSDDVVVAATSAEAATDGPSLGPDGPALALAGDVPALGLAGFARSAPSVRSSRAPPTV